MKTKRSVSFLSGSLYDLFDAFNYTPVSNHTYLHNIMDMLTLKVPMTHRDLVRVMAQRVTGQSGSNLPCVMSTSQWIKIIITIIIKQK